VEVRLNLKADGDKATGTMRSGAGKRAATAQIVDGKVDGNHFSFTTIQTTKKGEQRLMWEGTVDGDTMKGTRSRGGKRGQSFKAKRSKTKWPGFPRLDRPQKTMTCRTMSTMTIDPAPNRGKIPYFCAAFILLYFLFFTYHGFSSNLTFDDGTTIYAAL